MTDKDDKTSGTDHLETHVHPDLLEFFEQFMVVQAELVEPSDGATKKEEVVPKKPEPTLMSTSCRRGVGSYLIVLAVVLAVSFVPVWAWVSQLRGPATEATFLGITYTVTAEAGLLVLVMLAAMLGSVVALGRVFTTRASHETLEAGYLWWYLVRPLISAGLGLLFYVMIVAGLFSMGTQSNQSTLVVATVFGGLAGLFTDQVLAKMRKVLGQLSPTEFASGESEDTGDETVAQTAAGPQPKTSTKPVTTKR